MPNISYIRKKEKMTDLHFDGGDATAMICGAGFVFIDWVFLQVDITPAAVPLVWGELFDVCIKAAVGAVVGLTVKALFEISISAIKTKFNKPKP
jgi:hypothetical protein